MGENVEKKRNWGGGKESGEKEKGLKKKRFRSVGGGGFPNQEKTKTRKKGEKTNSKRENMADG